MEIEKEIAQLAEFGVRSKHAPKKFVAGESDIPVTGKVFGKEEISNAIAASLDFWLTSGPYSLEFESKIAMIMEMRHALMVNSGSSANLVAL